MRAVVARELVVIARRRALMAVICAYVGLLAAFVLVWNRGLPLPAAATLYEQLRVVQWAVLATLLPWAAARCIAPDRGDSLVVACVLTGVRPSSVVLAKAVALTGALGLIVCAGVPVAIMAQQMSAVPVWWVVRDLGSLLGLSVLVSAVTMAWLLGVRGRLAGWIGAGGSTVLGLVVLFLLPIASTTIGGIVAFVGVVLTVATATWSDGACRYLSERNV